MDTPDAAKLVGEVVDKMTGKGPDGHTEKADPVVVQKAEVKDPIVEKKDPAPAAESGKIVKPPASLFGKAPEEKKDPPAPVVDPTLPTDDQLAKMPPAPAKAMRDMRARIEAQNAKIAELEKAKPTAANTAEIEAIKKERDEFASIVDRVALEQSPRFRNKFEAPRQALIDKIKGYLKGAEIDESIADQALKLPFKERLALIGEHSDDLKPLIIPLLDRIDEIDSQRMAELQKSSEARKADQIEQDRQVSEFRQEAFKSTLALAVKENHIAFQTVDGDEAWNGQVAKTIERAKYLFECGDVEVQSAGLVMGAAAPVYLSLYRQERMERERLEGELAKYQHAMPRIRGTGNTPEPVQGAAPEGGRMTPAQAAAQVTAGLFRV